MRYPNADTMANEAQLKPSDGKPPEGVANHAAVRFNVIENTFEDDTIEEDPTKYQDNSTIISECYKIKRRRFLVAAHEDWSDVNFTFLDRSDFFLPLTHIFPLSVCRSFSFVMHVAGQLRSYKILQDRFIQLQSNISRIFFVVILN